MTESTGGSGWVSPAEFHRAPGVSDWRVTSGGPQAVFTSSSLAQAAALVTPVTDAAEEFGVLPDIDVRPEGIIVRIPGDNPVAIPAAAVAFANAVSAAAAVLGLTANPALVQTISVYVAQHSQVDVRPFFTAALGYDDLWDSDAVDPLRRGPQLAFNPISGDSPSRGRSHFDVYVPADQAKARVGAALAAGGRLVDDTHAPAWWTIASPDNHGVDIASWPDTYE